MTQKLTTAPTAMLSAATKMLSKSYAPYSQFHVGCCIEGADKNYYTGCNIENASYSLTQCAEATAIGSMISNGCAKIASILIIAHGNNPITPCGACRQRLLEFSDNNTIIYSCSVDGPCIQYNLNEMIPFSFGKKDLDYTQ